jgi:hypothetical protein
VQNCSHLLRSSIELTGATICAVAATDASFACWIANGGLADRLQAVTGSSSERDQTIVDLRRFWPAPRVVDFDRRVADIRQIARGIFDRAERKVVLDFVCDVEELVARAKVVSRLGLKLVPSPPVGST